MATVAGTTGEAPALEIHIKGGRVKVIEGVARRTYFSTEEAVGLALLRMNATSSQGADVKWVDFLAKRGLAIGAGMSKAFTLYVSAGRERLIRWRQTGSIGACTEMKATFPTTLLALCAAEGKIVKSQLWLVKAGLEDKLTVTLTEGCLAPFPYGNVYNHGGICWGTASLQGVTNPQDVEDAFFNSEFNTDLCYPNQFGRHESTLQEIVRNCAGILPSPGASGYGTSVQGVVRSLVG